MVLVLRVFPSVQGQIIPFIPRFWLRVSEDDDARAAVIWMLGEYGQDVVEAPYLLESAVNSYSQVLTYVLTKIEIEIDIKIEIEIEKEIDIEVEEDIENEISNCTTFLFNLLFRYSIFSSLRNPLLLSCI